MFQNQREARVPGFTGGFFIEEPDRPFVTGLSDIKTINYKIWRCVLRPFVLLLEAFQSGRDGGLYKFGS